MFVSLSLSSSLQRLNVVCRTDESTLRRDTIPVILAEPVGRS